MRSLFAKFGDFVKPDLIKIGCRFSLMFAKQNPFFLIDRNDNMASSAERAAITVWLNPGLTYVPGFELEFEVIKYSSSYVKEQKINQSSHLTYKLSNYSILTG